MPSQTSIKPWTESNRVKKANIVLPIAKADVAGLPFSFVDISSDRLDEGITSMMHTVSLRDSNQQWPVYFAHRYSYQLGPLPRAPLSVIHILSQSICDL
jgi:hypothetical protein